MSKPDKGKCCGACEYFMYEDVEGYGLCVLYYINTKCSRKCREFKQEEEDENIHITPDNGTRHE